MHKILHHTTTINRSPDEENGSTRKMGDRGSERPVAVGRAAFPITDSLEWSVQSESRKARFMLDVYSAGEVWQCATDDNAPIIACRTTKQQVQQGASDEYHHPNLVRATPSHP